MKRAKKPELVYTLECFPEDVPLEGNLQACGDEAADREAEREARRQLDGGNQWAWCCAKVTCRFADERYSHFCGVDTLGGCSYESEKAFMQDAYYWDMRDEAREDLRKTLVASVEKGVFAKELLLKVFGCGRTMKLKKG